MLKSDALLLTDVLQNFRKIYLTIYHLDSLKFLSAPGLAWQAALKKDWNKIIFIKWYWYVINGWKRYQRKNMSCGLSIYKS